MREYITTISVDVDVTVTYDDVVKYADEHAHELAPDEYDTRDAYYEAIAMMIARKGIATNFTNNALPAGVNAIVVDEVSVEEIRARNSLCIACKENEAYSEFESDLKLCPGCVDRAFTFFVVRDIVNTIGDYDVPLARAIAHCEEYDNANRNASIPMAYVDVLASSWDMIRAENANDIIARIDDVRDVLVNAIRGTSPDNNTWSSMK